MRRLGTGLSTTLEHTVTHEDTAVAVGSGSLPVLGTPRLLAWCEAATCAALAPVLSDGETSVGTRVTLEHLVPSAVGAALVVTASVVTSTGGWSGSASPLVRTGSSWGPAR